jgi:hypothetical protein
VGTWTLTECGWSYVSNDVWEMLNWVSRFEDHSLLPIPGAGCDQTEAFINALDVIPAYKMQLEMEMKAK